MSERVTKTEITPSVKRRVAASVFIVAFAFGLNITGILPVLGILNEKYQQYGTSAVQLLQTIMYLLLIVGSLMVGWMTTKISKKNITLLGLLIVGCCGVLPFFMESFAVLLIARIVIGFGYGIMGPMNTAIISEFFPPEERAGYMGLHVVGMGIGTMVGNLLGGMLAGIGYRYFYLVYLIAFAALLGVKAVLIETPPAQVEKASDLKLNKMVFVISFASFVHTLFINAYNTNIGIYITQNITEDPSVTGVVTAVNAAFALLVGMFFAKISGFFKTYTLTFSIFAAAVGYGVILFVPGMAGIYIASALCGVSLSCFMAIGSYLISISVEQEAVAKASGMFSIIGGIGGLIAPIFLGNAAKLLGENSARNQFVISFAGMLIFGVIVWITSANKAMKRYGFGVDIGGTTCKIGLFDMSGVIVEKWEIPTNTENNGAAILDDVAAAVLGKMEEKQIAKDDVQGIGLGVPGPVGADGTVHKCVNLGWGVINVEQILSEKTGLLVKAGNDANVAALGEMWQGGGKGHEDVVMVTLGTGVGGGIIIGGKMISGFHGAGGEIGHIKMRDDETDTCGCGKKGCLEQYASATGIVRMARQKLEADDSETVLRSLENLTAKDIFDAAKDGDKIAAELVEKLCRILGTALANIASIVDPEVFVIGGGVSRAGAILIDGIRKHFTERTFHACEATEITLATLGNDAGMYGCVRLLF